MNLIRNRYVLEDKDSGVPSWATPAGIRMKYPRKGFPKRMTIDDIADLGYEQAYRPDAPGTLDPVQPDPVYEADGVTLAEVQPDPVYLVPPLTPTQKLVWDALPTKVDGKWVQGYTVVEKTQEELLAEIPWQNYTAARKAVVQWIDNLTSQIESLYPSSVQKRWLIEEAAARAVAADDGSATQDQIDMMTNEGAAKGRTAQEHAAAVIQNADRFRAIADETNKLFLATDAQLQAAASPLEYPGIFEWAQAQAAPLAAAYGLSVE